MRLLLVLSVALAACARAPVAVAVPRAQVEPEAAKAEQAFGALKAKLMTRLTTAMGEGGPKGAIAVCSVEAHALTAELGTAHGLELGRTSFRLRNPKNAPRAWAAAHVSSAEPRPALFDLGDRIGVLQPMPLGALCVTCHGPREGLAPEIAAELAARYPEDQAVGFLDGALRGYFWAEVPKR